ncbi:serine hydrolase [Cohnella sp. WQ 127256]|uniref:serine hydrolase domain-containing protein n=1 Tax=Cohnella sp. WQ 127256 TaxID=2938790 RepID=UPI00211767CA|nr:serine hydrolase domain-containing protein [Cohnella sp. WQ 127256]
MMILGTGKVLWLRVSLMVLLIVSISISFISTVRAAPNEWKEDELSTFFNGFFAEKLNKIPGATIIAVNGDGVLFSKGYGYADKGNKLKADPDSTRYRVASISKLFTATAIMQLEEQGKVKLDEDINHYLPFRIPNRKNHPITLANLLTHTAGFDETYRTYNWNWPPKNADLGDFQSIYKPPIIRDPGTVKSYSNYGMALAGYIVQTQSGVPFAQYIDDRILRPLEMDSSSFSPTPEILSHLAVPYGADGQQIGEMNDWPEYIPTGSLFATASDMGKFMMALLQVSNEAGQQILQPDTKARMMSIQSSFHPMLGGVGYGFLINKWADMDVIWHGGYILGWQSNMWIIPGQNIGVFVAVNGDGDPGVTNELMYTFLNRFIPWTAPAMASESDRLSSDTPSAVDLAGRYIMNRYPSESVNKISILIENIWITATANVDGSITFSGIGNETYTYDRNGLWRNSRGDNLFASYQNRDGLYLQFSGLQAHDFRRISWYEDQLLHWVVIGGFTLFFALGTLVWIVASLRNRFNWHSIPGVVCGVFGVFIAGFYRISVTIGEQAHVSMMILLSLPVISAILLMFELARWLYRWRNRKLPANRSVRVILAGSGRVLLMLVQIIFLLYLNYWNLLGWSGLEY